MPSIRTMQCQCSDGWGASQDTKHGSAVSVVLEDHADKSGALAAYAEALKRAPGFREAHCNLAHLYEQLGRYQHPLFVAAVTVRWVRGQEYGVETVVVEKPVQSRVEHW
ncbi:MAG: hypothetical protein ABIU05_18910 [Nitrospirales bacterium]